MRPQPNREEDKKYLQSLAVYLEISDNRLKVDDCGDWNILGRKGHIFTDTEYWYVFVGETTKRKWSAIKHKLKWMELTQDGDDEGILRCKDYPFPEQALIIRETIGLNKRPVITEERRSFLIKRGNDLKNKGVSHSQIDLNQ